MNSYETSSVEFMPSGGMHGQNTFLARPVEQQTSLTILELPKHLEAELTREELEFVQQIEMMAYDQTGCRMIQRKLEENEAENRSVFA